ncbi:hypothetical protein A3860_33595 [Niastella vici]|uniref:Uncharacterized protein n=1 Tax=Niastella vici TaxID=1703345 RepID=A0A1V9FQ90_9BACT|nr:hypothetical protein [Niastella vici]OQP60457.1 hypothetical protein A3860_33595 [Niastella vici]
MQLKITFRYVIAFFALNMLMVELHEQAHIITGYLICGCYGPRDFNVWATCERCVFPQWSFLATLAGPVFSCSLMWLGAWLMAKSTGHKKKVLGFSLLFSNLPFARIFTALAGGGDEKIVIQAIRGNIGLVWSQLMAILIVTIICLPPMIIAYKKSAVPNRFLLITGFATIPLIYGMLYQHLFLNWLLKKGIGSQSYILGTPSLILLHFLLMLLLFFLFRKGLLQCGRLRNDWPVGSFTKQ